MGICLSTEERENRQRNDEIEAQLRRDEQRARTEVKMLLLGAGESGKSTILKQMKLIHDNGYSLDERMAFKGVIVSNVIHSMRSLLNAQRMFGIPLAHSGNRACVDAVMALPADLEIEALPPNIAVAIKYLWHDAGIQAVYARSNEFQLNDSAKYYFDNIDRIAAPNFEPSDQDVLRSRVRTTGITETSFRVGQLTYKMFDVGGQRSERKKWIHCFENVTAIVFMVAISEYDQKLVEDESVNRMQEALTLFESICNSRWFVKTSIILFLNKMDIFRDKIMRSPIEKFFPDYYGGANLEAASQYFMRRFVSLNQSPSKQVYTHFTCATDTQQINFVMAAVNDIIVQNSLRDIGLM